MKAAGSSGWRKHAIQEDIQMFIQLQTQSIAKLFSCRMNSIIYSDLRTLSPDQVEIERKKYLECKNEIPFVTYLELDWCIALYLGAGDNLHYHKTH